MWIAGWKLAYMKEYFDSLAPPPPRPHSRVADRVLAFFIYFTVAQRLGYAIKLVGPGERGDSSNIGADGDPSTVSI